LSYYFAGPLGFLRLVCNTLGVYHQLGNGFELKHDRLSGDDDANVKPIEINPNLNLDLHPCLHIGSIERYILGCVIKVSSHVSHQ
jgi:hypothetical protein